MPETLALGFQGERLRAWGSATGCSGDEGVGVSHEYASAPFAGVRNGGRRETSRFFFPSVVSHALSSHQHDTLRLREPGGVMIQIPASRPNPATDGKAL